MLSCYFGIVILGHYRKIKEFQTISNNVHQPNVEGFKFNNSIFNVVIYMTGQKIRGQSIINRHWT